MKKIISKLLFVIFFISGCNIVTSIDESSIELISMEVEKYPDKMIYIIGEDKDISAKGLEIKNTFRDGDTHIWWYEEDETFSKEEIKNVDLTKEGVYEVIISIENGVQCKIPIIVISKETLQQMAG